MHVIIILIYLSACVMLFMWSTFENAALLFNYKCDISTCIYADKLYLHVFPGQSG